VLALAAIMAAAAGFAFAMLPRISPDSSLRPAVEESLPVSAIVTVDAGGGGGGVAGVPVGVAAHLDSEAGVSLGDGPSAAVVDKAAGNGALPSADAHSTTSC